jgi:hypothetical protein
VNVLAQSIIDAADRGAGVDDLRRLLVAHRAEMGDLLAATPMVHHPLGFLQLRLAEVAGRVVRLHLWHADHYEPSMPYWPIHTHLYSLTSYVLQGAVQQMDYTADATAAEPTHRIYELEYKDSGSTRRPTTATVRLALTGAEIHHAGSGYDIPDGSFHQTSPFVTPGLTLVVSGYPTGVPAKVIGDLDSHTEHRYSPPAVSPRVREVCDGLIRKGLFS